MYNIEVQKQLKDFLPMSNKISELENERRIQILSVIDDFTHLKDSLFHPIRKSLLKPTHRRECEIKYRRQATNPVSRKIMNLVSKTYYYSQHCLILYILLLKMMSVFNTLIK